MKETINSKHIFLHSKQYGHGTFKINPSYFPFQINLVSALGLAWMMLEVANSQLAYSDMPIEVQECIHIFSNSTGNAEVYDVNDEIYVACLKEIMLKNRGLEGLNITVNDVQFMDTLINSVCSYLVLNIFPITRIKKTNIQFPIKIL